MNPVLIPEQDFTNYYAAYIQELFSNTPSGNGSNDRAAGIDEMQDFECGLTESDLVGGNQ